MIVALCGGVGGSKLALGLYRTQPSGSLTVVVNTADDLEFCRLHVSPDLDTVMYTLAGLAQVGLGWGVEGDTHRALDMLGRYGAPTWFKVGDADLATSVFRTARLGAGYPLSAVTEEMTRALGVQGRVIPATDDRVATRLLVGGDWVEFQEYFVHRRHRDAVAAVRYEGSEVASPAEGVIDAIERAAAVILVNSNPVLSILPILAIPGISQALRRKHPIVAVSPLIGSDAVSGPAGRLMHLIRQPPNAVGVAGAYQEILDGLIIDRQDALLAPEIEAMGVRVLATDTIMTSLDDRDRLAKETVAFAERLR